MSLWEEQLEGNAQTIPQGTTWWNYVLEENNRIGKNRDHIKKIRDINGTFHARKVITKDRNGKDLTESEGIKKRWHEYTE